MSNDVTPPGYRNGDLPLYADGIFLAMRADGHAIFQFFSNLPDGQVFQRPVVVTKQTLGRMAALISQSLKEDAKAAGSNAQKKAAKK